MHCLVFIQYSVKSPDHNVQLTPLALRYQAEHPPTENTRFFNCSKRVTWNLSKGSCLHSMLLNPDLINFLTQSRLQGMGKIILIWIILDPVLVVFLCWSNWPIFSVKWSYYFKASFLPIIIMTFEHVNHRIMAQASIRSIAYKGIRNIWHGDAWNFLRQICILFAIMYLQKNPLVYAFCMQWIKYLISP